MAVVVFKRGRRKSIAVKKLEGVRKKLATILKLLEKQRKEINGGEDVDIFFVTADDKNVEKIVRDAYERVEQTLKILEIEQELRKKGINAEAREDGIYIYDAAFDHYVADAELALKIVKELWKEKRGEGGKQRGGGSRAGYGASRRR